MKPEGAFPSTPISRKTNTENRIVPSFTYSVRFQTVLALDLNVHDDYTGMAENNHPRPLLVTLIAVLYLLIGIVFVIAGAVIVMGGENLLADTGFADLAGSFGGLGGGTIVLGIIWLIIGAGFFRGWKVFWYLGVIFAVIGLIVSIVGILGSPAMVVLAIVELIILAYLFKSNVKRFFLDHRGP